jgi:DNA repair exonuclease SbcCD nuclease subunit
MPKKSDKIMLWQKKLEDQLDITKNFKGKTLVIPGNHDWYSGLDGLKAQEELVKKYFDDKKAFLPKNSCPIDDISLTKDIKLIVIDTEWALQTGIIIRVLIKTATLKPVKISSQNLKI